MSDHYAVTYPRAAYRHQCGECCGTIPAGLLTVTTREEWGRNFRRGT